MGVVSELQEIDGSLPMSWCEEVSEGSKVVVGRARLLSNEWRATAVFRFSW